MKLPTLKDLRRESLSGYLDKIDRKLVVEALNIAELNIALAARLLKIRRSTLHDLEDILKRRLDWHHKQNKPGADVCELPVSALEYEAAQARAHALRDQNPNRWPEDRWEAVMFMGVRLVER